MARSRITAPSKTLMQDDGTVLLSVINGEQIHIQLQVNWIADLTNYNIHGKFVEADNDGRGTKPSAVATLPIKRLATVSNGLIRNVAGNTFTFVIPWNLCVDYDVAPTPGNPVYAFFEVEIGEPGTGDPVAPIGIDAPLDKQVWKPFRGLVEICYSPTEN